jgi:hypothetical protein
MEGRDLRAAEEFLSSRALHKGTTSQLAEKFLSVHVSRQGTTLVVPQTPQKKDTGFSPC